MDHHAETWNRFYGLHGVEVVVRVLERNTTLVLATGERCKRSGIIDDVTIIGW